MGTLAICAFVRNQGPFMLEWIAYHLTQGADRLFIYDNASTDETGSLLARIARRAPVTRIEWTDGAAAISLPHRPFPADVEIDEAVAKEDWCRLRSINPRIAAYHHCLRNFGDLVDWMAFLDVDEFFVPLRDQSMKAFVERFSGRGEVAAIAVNQKFFGTSGHGSQEQGLVPGFVIERVTGCAHPFFEGHLHVKSIVRPSCLATMFVHAAKLKSGKYVNERGEPIDFQDYRRSGSMSMYYAQINCYNWKPQEGGDEERQAGQIRGGDSRTEGSVDRDNECFGRHARNKEDVDFSIWRFLERTKQNAVALLVEPQSSGEGLPAGVAIDDLETIGLRDGADNLLVHTEGILAERDVTIAPPCGMDDLAEPTVVQHPFSGVWNETGYRAAPVRRYTLRNALVHSSAGVIVIANQLIKETLEHVHPPEHGILVDRATGGTRLQSSAFRKIPGRALHLLAGGAENYYHWLIDVLARFSVIPDEYLTNLILMPPLASPFHRTFLELLAKERPLKVQAIGACETVEVEELVFVPKFAGSGFYPRPEMLAVFDHLVAGLRPDPPTRRLYLKRGTGGKRPLLNEEEVAARLEEKGFICVDPGALPVEEQIRLFAEATHVVAAHGAGLANLVFCRPGAAVFELVMDSFASCLFQRLANIRGLRYGCAVGETVGPWNPAWPHDRSWRISIDRLEIRLAAAGFLV